MVVGISEEQRKKLVISFQYDPNDTFWNLLRWKGTIFSFVVQKGQVWLLIIFHSVLWGMYHYHKCLDGDDDPIPDCTPAKEFLDQYLYPPSLRDLGPLIGAFMFCIIFYLQSAYAVYREFYFNQIQISGAVKNAAFIVRASLQSPDARWDVVRHLICSQRVLYWEVTRRSWQWRNLPESHESNPGTIREMAERELVPQNLIRKEEIQVLEAWRGSIHQLFYSWSIQVFRRELLLTRKHVPEDGAPPDTDSSVMNDTDAALTVQQFSHLCFNLRDACSRLHAMLLIPVPFPYYHLVEAMSFSVQLVMAYAFININGNLRTQPAPLGEVEQIRTSHLAILIFPLTVFVCTGITEMANKMQDPFGNDEVDFNLEALKDDLYDSVEAQCYQEYDAIPIPEVLQNAVTEFQSGATPPTTLLSPTISRKSNATVKSHVTDTSSRAPHRRASLTLPLVRGGLEGIISAYEGEVTRLGSGDTTMQRVSSSDTYQGSFKREPQSPGALLKEISGGTQKRPSVNRNGFLRDPPAVAKNDQGSPLP